MSGTSSSARIAAAAFALIPCVVLAGACDAGSEGPVSSAVAFEGARVIVGDGSVIEDAVFVVDGGRFAQVGAAGEVDVPEGAAQVDLSGKTVIPAIVNAHFHLNPEREARTEQLQHSAYYGTALAVSLGLDEGDASFEMRDEVLPDGARSQTAGRGITSPEPGRSEVPHWVTTEEEARAAVQELAAQQVDIVKIWVDDRGGQYERLSPELYGAVIDEAHANGLRVTAHVFRLEDAKGCCGPGWTPSPTGSATWTSTTNWSSCGRSARTWCWCPTCRGRAWPRTSTGCRGRCPPSGSRR